MSLEDARIRRLRAEDYQAGFVKGYSKAVTDVIAYLKFWNHQFGAYEVGRAIEEHIQKLESGEFRPILEAKDDE